MQHFNAKFDQLKDIELEPIDKDDIIKGYNELDEELKNAKDGAEAVNSSESILIMKMIYLPSSPWSTSVTPLTPEMKSTLPYRTCLMKSFLPFRSLLSSLLTTYMIPSTERN